MAKTLLNATNDILKRVGIIAGDSAVLTTLTDTARQVDIDLAGQVINEGIDELYSTAEISRPNQQTSSSLALVTSTRAYSLASDLVRLHWPLRDNTNAQFIWEYTDGYEAMLTMDALSPNNTGLPIWAVIRPTDGKLYVNTSPTSAENGNTYTYVYDKDTILSDAADTVPFSNVVYRAMLPVWSWIWRRERRGEFDAAIFKANLGRASRLLTQVTPSTSYNPRA